MILATLLAALSAAAFQPHDVHDAHDAEAWRFQLTPYVWMPSFSGRVRPIQGFPTIHVDKSFGDLLSDLEGAFFLTGSARRDRFVLLGDFTWSSTSSTSHLNFGDLGQISVEAGEQQTTLTGAAGATVARNSVATLDLYAGLRLWRLRVKAGLPAADLRASETATWADPIIGARFRANLTPRWSVLVQADGGGLGVFNGSESTFQVVATANWRLSSNVWLSAGWRHLAVDYHKDGTIADIELRGPLLGATWRF